MRFAVIRFESRLSWLLLVALAGSLSSGCSGSSKGGGSSGGDGTPSSSSVSEAEFREQYPDLFCRTLEMCCTEAGYDFDPAFCRLLSQLGPADPSLTYHPEAAGACLALARETTSCEAEAGESPCDAVYTGNAAVGEPCQSKSECAPIEGATVSCDPFDDVCSVEYRSAAGEPCTYTCEETSGGQTCTNYALLGDEGPEVRNCFQEDGLFCADDGTCHAVGVQGAACTGSHQCGSNLYCDGLVCAPALAQGEACETYGASCQDGFGCGPDGVCAVLAADGEPCLIAEECQSQICSDAGTCGFDGAALGDALFGLFCGAVTS